MNDQNMEPAAEDLLRNGKEVAGTLSHIPPLYSLAISMKRIADVLEGAPEKYGIFHILSDMSQSIAKRG